MNANAFYAWLAEREALAKQKALENDKPLPPVDAARRRVIGYNGYGKVKRNGQVFRTHSGR